MDLSTYLLCLPYNYCKSIRKYPLCLYNYSMSIHINLLFSVQLQHGHPYVSAMVNNGSLHYDHDRDGTHTELAGCSSNFRGITNEAYLAVRYENQKLTVSYCWKVESKIHDTINNV